MHDKAHDARGKHVVLHVDVPRRPQLLKVVERDIVFAHLLDLAPVRVLRQAERVIALRGG